MNNLLKSAAFDETRAKNINNQHRQNILKMNAPNVSNVFGRTQVKPTARQIQIPTRSNELFSALKPFFEKIHFSAGDYIHQPNDPIDYIYFPETAVVSEFQILEDGRAVGVSLHGDESVLGLLSIFDARPAENWTQVLLSGSVFKIKSEIFKAKFLQHQRLQTLVFENVNNHIKQLSQRVVCNSYHTLEERFCAFLLMLQDCRKNCSLSVSQEQIAYFLGTHRPSVTQIATSLRTRKTINYLRRNLEILDRAKLKEYACNCYQ